MKYQRNGLFNLFIIIIVISACLASCESPKLSSSEFIFGTVCTITLFDQGQASNYRPIFKRLKEIDDQMSANKTGSEVSAINDKAGIEPVVVSPELIAVLQKAVVYAKLSDGAFDPTIGALVKLWDIGGARTSLPESAEIKAALSLIAWQDLVIDESQQTVFLTRPGMRLDLGAIAKGFAADEVARLLENLKVSKAIIDLGGNILVYGTKPDNSDWRIGIQDPSGLRGEYLGIVSIKNKSLVTSGVYERFFEFEGQRYHHLLSTEDGYPVNNGLLSVTIIAAESIEADALSTTCFVLGYDAGRKLVESLADIQAVFVFNDGSIRATEGAKTLLQITNYNYQLK